MARAIAKTDAYVTSRRQRKKVEMLFAHLKRILKLDRLRLRGPNGARDEFHLAAAAQNLSKLAKLIPMPMPKPGMTPAAAHEPRNCRRCPPSSADFFNGIGAMQTWRRGRSICILRIAYPSRGIFNPFDWREKQWVRM